MSQSSLINAFRSTWFSSSEEDNDANESPLPTIYEDDNGFNFDDSVLSNDEYHFSQVEEDQKKLDYVQDSLSWKNFVKITASSS